MDITKKRGAILYIDNNRVFFFGSNLPDMMQMDLPPDTISDLELINKEKLDLLIRQFVETNKIIPTEITMLLSPLTTFEKDLSKEDTTADDQDIIKFLEYVPFEHIISRAIKMEKKLKLIVVNKEFYDAFKLSFEKVGFHTSSILPLSVIQETIPELAQNLNLQVILDKADSLKQYSLVPAKEMDNPTVKKKTNHQTKSLHYLLGIFGFLITILAITYFYTNFSAPAPLPKTTPQTRSIPEPTNTFVPTGIPLPSISSYPTITPNITQGVNNNIPTITR